MSLFRYFVLFMLFFAVPGSAGCRRSEPEPTLPEGAQGNHVEHAGRMDWSFLGPANPARVKEHVRMLRPFVAEGNLVPEEPEIAERQRGEAVIHWVSRLVASAAEGAGAVVTLTMTHCVGWGSATPSEYTVFGCFTPLAIFVHPTNSPEFETRCRACSREDDACVERECAPVRVEGRFTGKIHKVQMDPEDPSTARESYEFFVFRHEKAGATREALEIDPAMEIRLPAGYPAPAGTPVTNGPRFAVVHEVDMVWAPTSLDLAHKLAEELKSSGMTKAFVMDSRLVPDIWCCSHLVVASRHTSLQEAKEAQKSLPPSFHAHKWRVAPLY